MISETIFWEITNCCNLNCPHCYLGKQKNSLKLFGKEEAINIISVLKRKGVKRVLFTGGEPLMYPYIYDVIKKARELKMHVCLLTNGTLLSKKVVKRLKENDVSAVQISIDGIDELYKRVRGVDFQIIDENIKHLQKERIPIRAKFTINRLNANIKEFKKVLDYCSEREIKLSTGLTIGIGNAERNIVVTPREYFKLLVQLFYLKEEEKSNGKTFSLPDFSIEEYLRNGEPETGCDAGRGVSGITVDGMFFPCIFLSEQKTRKLFEDNLSDLSIINCFNRDLTTLFKSHPLFLRFREYSANFFDCPIRKKIYGKDPFSVYEFIKVEHQIFKKLKRG